MNHRVLVMPAAIAVAALSFSSVAGQSPTPQARGGNAAGSSIPRTSDGRPDLDGFWTNDTVTPLERPTEFGDRAVITAAEAAAYAKKRMDQFLAQPKDDIHYDDAIWQGENYTKQTTLRTSLVVDPPNGRLPPLTPAGAGARGRTRQAGRSGRSVRQCADAHACRALHLVGQRRASDDPADLLRQHADPSVERARRHPA